MGSWAQGCNRIKDCQTGISRITSLHLRLLCWVSQVVDLGSSVRSWLGDLNRDPGQTLQNTVRFGPVSARMSLQLSGTGSDRNSHSRAGFERLRNLPLQHAEPGFSWRIQPPNFSARPTLATTAGTALPWLLTGPHPHRHGWVVYSLKPLNFAQSEDHEGHHPAFL